MSERRDSKSTAEAAYHAEASDLGGRDRHMLLRLWEFARPYKAFFLLGLVTLPLVSAMSLVQPQLLQIAIDDHLAPAQPDGLGLLVVLFFVSVVGQFIFAGGQFLLFQWAGLRTLKDMRMSVYRHLQRLKLSFFHKNPVGRLMTRLTTDIDSLQDAIAGGMVTLIADLITLGAIVVILLVKNWRLALVTFACVPVLFVLSVIFRVLMRRAYQVIRVRIARLNAYLQEAVTGMSIIQLFNRERRSQGEFSHINREHRDAQYRQIRWDAMLFAVVETISSIAVALIIWYGAGQALDGVVTLGVLVAFVEYVRKFFIPIRDLAQKYALYQSAMASSERIFDLLDNSDSLPRPSLPTIERPSRAGLDHRIEFRDVWFSYAEQTPEDNWILRGVSFVIEAGERVALVGRTGAGKTTIISLLTRMHDIQRGEILIDDVDVRDWDLDELRRMFSVVLQDPFLFSGTVRENITLREPTITDAAAELAADRVHVSELLKDRPEGLDLEVMERGGNLSTGEKQLVAFARALARDPAILILDEATANVDTQTESLIEDAIQVLLEQRTSVVIAHRLSTIRAVDKILVMHQGELAEAGSHDELIEQGGLYAKLYELEYELAA